MLPCARQLGEGAIPTNPNTPVTVWILVTMVATAVTVGVPLLIGLLSFKRAAREGREKDVATLVTPIIAALIKLHNEETYAHPVALARYATLDTFNAALRELRSEIGSVRTLIESNEQHRKDDVERFREDFGDLKKNVARAVGKKDEEL